MRTVRALVVRKEAGIRVMSEALREMMSVMWRPFSWSLRDMYSRTGACHNGMTSGNCTPLDEGETGEEIMFLVTRRGLTPLKDDVDMAVSWGPFGMTILYVLHRRLKSKSMRQTYISEQYKGSNEDISCQQEETDVTSDIPHGYRV